MSYGRIFTGVLALWFGVAGARAQVATFSARVEVEGASKSHAPLQTTVVWLTPMGELAGPVSPAVAGPALRLTQKNKSFDPHVLVVPAGSAVEFPNRDPFFHNVFSLFEGKRFDLGLYEAGTSRVVHFDRPGISYIFCNIHPEMSAVVITLNTPLYGVINGEGRLEIANVPFGRYRLSAWSESNGPESTPSVGQQLTISEKSPKLVAIRVPALSHQSLAHKNKYGREYDAPVPDSPVYHQQP